MTESQPITIPGSVVEALRSILQQLTQNPPYATVPTRATPSVNEPAFDGPRLLSAVEAGKVLGIHAITVRQLWNVGELKCVQIGRGRKVSTVEIDRYIGANERFMPTS